MPVLAEIVASPLLAAAAAIVGAQGEAAKPPADPCRAPAIRLESADRSTVPGPDSPACRAAMEQKKKQKTGKAP